MKNRKLANVLLTVMGVLIIAELAEMIYKISANPTAERIIRMLPRMLSLVFTALYGFWLYKKPHGNMLKYAMVVFAITTIVASCNYMVIREDTVYVARILASAAICYCAGRLNRIDQNKYILPIIGLVFLATSIYFACMYAQNGFLSAVPHFRSTINYFTLMIAYFVRFREHKLAGVADAM